MKLFAAAKASLAVIKTDAEAAVRKCSSKYVLLEILQYLQENTCVGVSFL